jgi:MSHA pilin protein MshC
LACFAFRGKRNQFNKGTTPDMRKTGKHGSPILAGANARGFTLVELVLVIIILGILGALAAGRLFDRADADGTAYADHVRSMLRYAQKLAVAQNRNVHVRLSGNAVALCYQSGCGVGARVLAPAGNNAASAATAAACGDNTWYCEAPPSTATLTITPVVATFYFDPIGKPFAAADVSPTTVSTFAQLTVRVTANGRNRDLIVERETGYVH